MVGKDLIMATLLGSGGGEGEKSPLDALIDRSITEISSDAETVGDYAFYHCEKMTSAYFPNAAEVDDNAFEGCYALTTASIPNATRIGKHAFAYTKNVTTADFPLVTGLGAYAFYSSEGLKTAHIPLAKELLMYAFSGCARLETADFSVPKAVNAWAFGNCYSLKALILRKETAVTLSSTNALGNCYHLLGTGNTTYNPDGLADGYIYVPSALVDTYKAATNWSTYANQFRALEDYTVDGTITGDLDENKI